MKLNAGHKIFSVLAVFLTAGILCTLPFRVLKKNELYIYTKSELTSEEKGFIDELKRLGFSLNLNAKTFPEEKTSALWLDTPNALEDVKKSQAEFNFIYTTSYYPLSFTQKGKAPVILTPYKDLYEHYVRSNQKSALFSLGVNLKDFYKKEGKKIYTALYYGDNNKIFPFANELQDKRNIRFMGNFWPAEFSALQPETPKDRAKILNQSDIVIIYNDIKTAQAKKIPQELAEAVSCGALVLSTPNSAVSKLYGDNIIYYDTFSDLDEKLTYYLNKKDKIKHINRALQKITIEKYSSAVMAKRFKEILLWLSQNTLKPALK